MLTIGLFRNSIKMGRSVNLRYRRVLMISYERLRRKPVVYASMTGEAVAECDIRLDAFLPAQG